MTKRPLVFVGLTVFACAIVALPAGSQDASPFTTEQEQRVEELVRAYLLDHPEVLVEARRVLQERQAEEAAAQFTAALEETREGLLHDPVTPVGGNPDGAVSVVEFFDYNCPHCRRASPIVAEMLKANPDVRLVYKEWPILGEPSEFAARAALAAHRQSPELYESFHAALMVHKDKLTEDAVIEIARDVGIDLDRMRSDMDDPAIAAHIARNVELIRALGIQGTPAFVIGNELLPGFKPLAALESAIEKARAIQ